MRFGSSLQGPLRRDFRFGAKGDTDVPRIFGMMRRGEKSRVCRNARERTLAIRHMCFPRSPWRPGAPSFAAREVRPGPGPPAYFDLLLVCGLTSPCFFATFERLFSMWRVVIESVVKDFLYCRVVKLPVLCIFFALCFFASIVLSPHNFRVYRLKDSPSFSALSYACLTSLSMNT